MSSGRVYGNTTSHSLVIDEGGIFQGNSRMEVKSADEEKAKNPDSQQQQQQQQQNHAAPGFSSGYSSSPSPL